MNETRPKLSLEELAQLMHSRQFKATVKNPMKAKKAAKVAK